MASEDYSDIFSIPRFTTLLVSLLVTLASGTNYVYSAYAPQLGARLNISHLQLNIVGLAGNLGVYITGPIWGRIVDMHGPRMPMASSFVLLIVGYAGIKFVFDAGISTNTNASAGTNTISFFTSCVLVLCGFMTGAGGNAGLTGAVNSTAKTFPDKTRATATGLVISGFGLSAFLFSTISRVYFTNNTSTFLSLLALGTSLPMIAGFFFVRPIPLPTTEDSNMEGGERRIEIGNRRPREDRDEELDDEHDGEQSMLLPLSSPSLGTSSPSLPSQFRSFPSSPSLPRHPTPTPSSPSLPRHLTPTPDPTINIRAQKLFKSTDFWLLFSILSLLAGTGITYINNAGLMSQALYIHSLQVENGNRTGGGGTTYDPATAAHYQADQVALISLFNFTGRILIGLLTDTLTHTHHLPRSTSLTLVSTLFLLSQLLAAVFISDVAHLYITSATLGLAYGSVFSLMPNVCLEWFGMAHFSENWGYLCIAPIICGNIFAIIFGRNLDAHDTAASAPSPSSSASFLHPSSLSLSTTSANVVPPPSVCTLGRKCYAEALYLTLFACLVALGLSVWAGWRDRRRVGLRHSGGRRD